MEVGMGLYTDAGLANLPQTIAMIGGSFIGSDVGMMGHRNKRSRTNTSSSSSGGETSSADDKKMMERERNRRQARKSRTLKKQCTDRMQEQLTQLHKEAEEVEARNKEAAQKLATCRDDRRRALRMVFDLRAEGSVDEDAWAELVSEDLRLTMPITPYRSFSPADVVNNRRVLLGVDGMISDVQSLNVSCDNIGTKTRRNEGPVSIEYTLGCEGDSGGDGGGAFFNSDGLMCTFTMSTLDAM